MSDFKLLLLICGAIYASECFAWVPSGGLLFLSWVKRFSLVPGPSFRFKNPWPAGFAYRFDPRGPFSQKPSLNSNDAMARRKSFQASVKTLLWLSRSLLIVCASAFLLYVVRQGLPLAWIILFVIFLALHVSIGILFWKKHEYLYPGNKGRKIRKTLLCAFSPFQSVRSVDLLEELLFSEFHPLVIGQLLLEDEDFSKLCRRWLLEIKYPALVLQEPETSPLLLSGSREEEEKALLRWASGRGIKPSIILAPLRPSHPSHLSYCQRCETEYQIEKGLCHDCGRDLTPF